MSDLCRISYAGIPPPIIIALAYLGYSSSDLKVQELLDAQSW